MVAGRAAVVVAGGVGPGAVRRFVLGGLVLGGVRRRVGEGVEKRGEEAAQGSGLLGGGFRKVHVRIVARSRRGG